MTIDKAIEILTFIINEPYNFYTEDDKTAIKLGREALILIDQLRFDGSPYYPNELPGEEPE